MTTAPPPTQHLFDMMEKFAQVSNRRSAMRLNQALKEKTNDEAFAHYRAAERWRALSVAIGHVLEAENAL